MKQSDEEGDLRFRLINTLFFADDQRGHFKGYVDKSIDWFVPASPYSDAYLSLEKWLDGITKRKERWKKGEREDEENKWNPRTQEQIVEVEFPLNIADQTSIWVVLGIHIFVKKWDGESNKNIQVHWPNHRPLCSASYLSNSSSFLRWLTWCPTVHHKTECPIFIV